MSATPAIAKQLAAAVRILPGEQAIQVTPEHVTRKNAPAPAQCIPLVGVFDWQPAGDGTFKPIIRLHEQMMRMNVFAKIVDIDYFALRRLVTAGFVEGQPTTPGAWHVNVHSYFAHVEAVRTDPDFWTEARRARYSAAL